MSTYQIFCKANIGKTFTLCVGNGIFDFIKISDHLYSVVYSVKNDEPFLFTRFTAAIPTIEAASLYDLQNILRNG